MAQRLEQITFWPWQYCLWRMSGNRKTMSAQAKYIGFYNLIWLIGNDLILGFSIAGLISRNESMCNHIFSLWIKVYIQI